MNILGNLFSGRTIVRSSNLYSVGYNPFTGVLEVQFRNGRVYEYHDVPPAVHDGLMNAHSHGHFFAIFIRNVYPFRRIQ